MTYKFTNFIKAAKRRQAWNDKMHLYWQIITHFIKQAFTKYKINVNLIRAIKRSRQVCDFYSHSQLVGTTKCCYRNVLSPTLTSLYSVYDMWIEKIIQNIKCTVIHDHYDLCMNSNPMDTSNNFNFVAFV